MSVNDILVQGAEPLFFLDYFACGGWTCPRATEVIQGIALGLRAAGCAAHRRTTTARKCAGMLIRWRVTTLAGFAVGAVEKKISKCLCWEDKFQCNPWEEKFQCLCWEQKFQWKISSNEDNSNACCGTEKFQWLPWKKSSNGR